MYMKGIFFVEKDQSELAWEKQRLEQTIALAKSLLEQAIRDNEGNSAEIAALREEMRENSSHAVSGYSSSQDFEDLAEISQYANPVMRKLSDYETVARKIALLERLAESPYFASIDFQFEQDGARELVYIGRSSLMRSDTREIAVFDWRSPIASVFYRFASGPAYYDAPAGRIMGDVRRKRQYEIHGGVLEYFFDADVQVIDEFLRKLLSQNTSPSMKSIVETIQKDQDIIIRDMENDLMMVQGAAGSGKTSIALHRAAYLMYQGLSSGLSAHQIIILSPNTMFARYISHVLPELGEENAVPLVMEELLGAVLHHKQIQTRNQYLEKCLTGAIDTTIMQQSMAFKTSRLFIEILDRFIEDIPQTWIDFTDVYYGNHCIISKESLKSRVASGAKSAPLGFRLRLAEEYILESAKELYKARADQAEYHRVKDEARRITELDVPGFYRLLTGDEGYFRRLAEGLPLPGHLHDILQFTQKKAKANTLPYDDAAAIAYLRLRLAGMDGYANIKQVVIDEAQDYYPLHYELFRLLFPGAKFTVLGDFNQSLEKQEGPSLYDQIRLALRKEKSTLVTLDKSFRCTNEILRFSIKFIPRPVEIQSFNRDGGEPEIYVAADRASLRERIAAEVRACLAEGYQSVGLLCKTGKNAVSLYKELHGATGAQLVAMEGAAELQGALVIPIYMSKGLEFDAVLLCDASKENYHTEDDKALLYIACTRALHRLNLFCMGEASPFLQ